MRRISPRKAVAIDTECHYMATMTTFLRRGCGLRKKVTPLGVWKQLRGVGTYGAGEGEPDHPGMWETKGSTSTSPLSHFGARVPQLYRR